MACEKCGYKDEKNTKVFGKELCRICSVFCPHDEEEFKKYAKDKIDWMQLEVFRRHSSFPGVNQREGMKTKAKNGSVVNRAPMGYSAVDKKLILNEDAPKIIDIYNEYLNCEISLNKLSKKHGLSVNGLKKILMNRAYIGEMKFAGEVTFPGHRPIISKQVFYAVQRKIVANLRPRKHNPENYKHLRGEVAPLEKEMKEIKEVFTSKDEEDPDPKKKLYLPLFDK